MPLPFLSRRQGATAPPPVPPTPADLAPHMPFATDWAWHAQSAPAAQEGVPSGHKLAQGISLFHDGAPETLRLEASASAITIGAKAFGGAYLSLVFDLPPAAFDGLCARHILRLGAKITATHPQKTAAALHARLNLRQGERLSQELRAMTPPPDGSLAIADFELAHLPPPLDASAQIWIDLIVTRPPDAPLRFSELYISRHMRAGF